VICVELHTSTTQHKELQMTPADFKLTQADFDAHPNMTMEAIQDLYYQDAIADEAMAKAEAQWEDSGCSYTNY
jgi:hypothetical protein